MRPHYWLYRLQEHLYCTEKEALMLLAALAMVAASLGLRALRMDATALSNWSHADMDSLFFALAARADSLDKVGTPAEYILWSAPNPVAAADTIEYPININTATAELLQHLPRIGPAMANRILAERERLGAFKTVDDLLLVRGIGDKTLENLRELVTVSTDASRPRTSHPDSLLNASGQPP